MRARRLILWFAGLACGALMLGGASAQALDTHILSSHFGSAGAGAGQVSLRAGTSEVAGSGVTVDPVTHDVLVADTGNARVDEFESNGTFVRAWGWGVADGFPAFETCTLVCQQGLSGSGPGQFTAPTFVAIDRSGGPSNGDVYVGDAGTNVVSKFSALGAYLSSNDGSAATAPIAGPFGALGGIAVDGSGDLWVYDTSGHMFEFAQDGSFLTDWESGRGVTPSGIAVDSSTNLYIGTGEPGIAKFSSSGAQIGDVEGGGSTGFRDAPTGVAIESSTKDIYVDKNAGINHFTACEPANGHCPPADVFGGLNAGTGLGVDPGDHTVYVAETAAGQIDVFTSVVLPDASTGEADVLSKSSATLKGTVSPDGVPLTVCQFEYGPTLSYGSVAPCETTPSPDGGPQAVSATVTGLPSGRYFHFRLIVRNASGSGEGSDVTFTTIPDVSISTLPDNRAYELLSSPAENQDMYYPLTGVTASGTENEFQTVLPFRAADDGNSAAYPGEPSIDGGTGAIGSGNGNQYLAIRGGAGWSARDISPGTGPTTQYEFFSSDLSVAEFRSVNAETITEASPQGPIGCPGIYWGVGGEDGYHSFFSTSPIPGPCPGMFSAGASADGSHLLFEAGGILTAEAQAGQPKGAGNLYDSVGGQLYMVNVLPDGQPEAAPAASFGGPRFAREASPDLSNFVSSEGSRIFWSSVEAPESEKPLVPKALYVRENDTRPQSPIGSKGECTVSADACTVQIDAGEPACVSEGACGSGSGLFWTASGDGSRVFFTDCQWLTANSTAVASGGCIDEENEEEGLTGNDLYEYDVETSRLNDLTVDSDSGDPLGADVKGVVGASEDGSYVYFVAGGALAPGATSRICLRPRGRTAEEDKEGREEERGLLPAHHGCNLYVRHAGVTTFISALVFKDNGLQPILGNGVAPRGDWRAGLGERTARVTPDGKSLVFTSTRRLTNYESEGLREVFVYDASTDKVSCASCDPSGAPPAGDPERFPGELGDYLPTSNQTTFMERFISDDGSRVFFETSQALVPQDTNGIQDVYEWERNGAGSCTAAAAGAPEPGCIYLLSAGDSSEQAYIVDSDASGDNLFFMTRNRLIPQAQNETIVVYDARVDGGFQAPSLACTGTGCQGVPPAPPIFATPSSTTFNGVGNFPPPTRSVVKPRSKSKQCKRGFAKKHGKCVRKKAAKKRRPSAKKSKSSTRTEKGRQR